MFRSDNFLRVKLCYPNTTYLFTFFFSNLSIFINLWKKGICHWCFVWIREYIWNYLKEKCEESHVLLTQLLHWTKVVMCPKFFCETFCTALVFRSVDFLRMKLCYPNMTYPFTYFYSNLSILINLCKIASFIWKTNISYWCFVWIRECIWNDLREKCEKIEVVWIKVNIVKSEGKWMENLWKFVSDVMNVIEILIDKKSKIINLPLCLKLIGKEI